MTAPSKIRTAWTRWLWVRPPNDDDVGETKRISITNGAALFIGILGPLFLVLNLTQGQTGLAAINAATSLIGVVSLVLLHRGLSVAAAATVLCGSGVFFALSALLYRNGMEYTLLVCMFGAVFMFGSAVLRALFAGLNAIGFLVVKLHEFTAYTQADFPVARYAVNLAIFLVSFHVLHEMLRSAYAKYHRQIERTNAELAESRRQLHEEHVRLMARTEELRVANEAKEKLFSIIAHDLRTPLGGLSGTLNLLNSGDLDAKDFQSLASDLSINVGHVHECLDTLLAWAASQLRGITPKPTAMSPARAADDCVGLLAASATRKNIRLQNLVHSEARVWADENQVRAILRNLVANALKFTPAGGEIRIIATEEPGRWRITVSDTGVGMSPEKVRGLFSSGMPDPAFGTDNERGLGLGLAICREFVESNAGTLSVESTLGVGSQFSFTLPAGAPAGNARDQKQNASTGQAAPERQLAH